MVKQKQTLVIEGNAIYEIDEACAAKKGQEKGEDGQGKDKPMPKEKR